jgi:hypothetical protein
MSDAELSSETLDPCGYFVGSLEGKFGPLQGCDLHQTTQHRNTLAEFQTVTSVLEGLKTACAPSLN